MSDTPRAVGRPYRRARQRMLDESDICWLCGHGGADTADHVIPRSLGGDVSNVANLRPAHGEPCPTCGQRCNYSRGNRMVVPRSPTSRPW